MTFRIASIVCLGLAVTGCRGAVVQQDEARAGVIAFHADPVTVEVPDTVEAETPFEVDIRTYGDGCTRKGALEVEADGLRVDVHPYDINTRADACTEQLKIFNHRASLVFREAGLGEIRFHGIEVPADTTVEVVRSVVVKESRMNGVRDR